MVGNGVDNEKLDSTIRSVPSLDGFVSSPESKHSNYSSTTSDMSALSTLGPTSPSEQIPPMMLKRPSVSELATKWNVTAVRAVDPASAQNSPVLPELAEQDGEWDSTVGKAGLGKTGRVINKLVSDNDALKREIRIERLLAEEAKQAAQLIEDKMERIISDYESRLLEAGVTKTLLARKERQVETLTSMVEAEKRRTQAAQEREKSWREEMEKVRSESTTQVEEAATYAQLMEGRYNAISSHWRDQGAEVNKTVSGLRSEIEKLVEERRKDDEKIQTLRDLCDQQDSNIKQLTSDKDSIAKLFEEYKKTQEAELADIKAQAKAREQEQDGLIEESREALAKLKWALNVHNNLRDDQ